MSNELPNHEPPATGARTLFRQSRVSSLQKRAMPERPHPRYLPVTRAECVDGPRPCPYVSCRHHLYLDVTPAGTVVSNHLDVDLDELPATCVLDLVEGEQQYTIDECGEYFGVSRERVRQIEEISLRKLGASISMLKKMRLFDV